MGLIMYMLSAIYQIPMYLGNTIAAERWLLSAPLEVRDNPSAPDKNMVVPSLLTAAEILCGDRCLFR